VNTTCLGHSDPLYKFRFGLFAVGFRRPFVALDFFSLASPPSYMALSLYTTSNLSTHLVDKDLNIESVTV